jgi:hypothetical protein
MPTVDMDYSRRGPGRPPKYGRPSRAVTVTLPEDVISRLGVIDTDLGRAIVAVAERRAPRPRTIRSAELATYGRHAVIVVTPVKTLNRLPGVQLVPIGNGRALISLEHPQSTPQLELDIRDALERADEPERTTLEAIADILRQARLSKKVDLQERTIIVLEAKRRRGSNNPGRPAAPVRVGSPRPTRAPHG